LSHLKPDTEHALPSSWVSVEKLCLKSLENERDTRSSLIDTSRYISQGLDAYFEISVENYFEFTIQTRSTIIRPRSRGSGRSKLRTWLSWLVPLLTL
jgi:hypothetical protein